MITSFKLSMAVCSRAGAQSVRPPATIGLDNSSAMRNGRPSLNLSGHRARGSAHVLDVTTMGSRLRIMPRRLITLISTEGKTPEQITSELLANQAKYQAVLAKHLPEEPAKK